MDESGTVVWAAVYDAFGEAEILVDDIENNLRFPGQYFDVESGLHYNWNRYYDPDSARYTQTDPIGFEGGDENLYAYVRNGPISWSDPWGLVVMNNSGPWILDKKGNIVRNFLWTPDSPGCKVYVKPGGPNDYPDEYKDRVLPGETAHEVLPGTCFIETRQDGVGSPDHPKHPDKVLKTRGGDVTVNPNCTFDSGRWWLLNSWKDQEWQDPAHPDWQAIFDAVMGTTHQ